MPSDGFLCIIFCINDFLFEEVANELLLTGILYYGYKAFILSVFFSTL